MIFLLLLSIYIALVICDLFMDQMNLRDSVSILYWISTMFFIPGVISCFLVWGFTNYHYSRLQASVRNTSYDTNENDEYQTNNHKASDSKESKISGLSGISKMMDLREFCFQTKQIFSNPMFIGMAILCFHHEGLYFALGGSLKQLLMKKFMRSDKQTGYDFGLQHYFGLVAPLTGFMVDKLKNRQWFVILGAMVVMLSHMTLAFGIATDFNRISGLLGISLGSVIYANAFWPAVASVVGKQYQIIAYGWLSAIGGAGAVVAPLIAGYYTDQSDVIAAQYLFMFISILVFVLSIFITVLNCLSNVDYLNRDIHNDSINDDDNELGVSSANGVGSENSVDVENNI